MSKKELVLVASRAFALLLISWGTVEVTYLPQRLLTLSHHLSQRSVFHIYDYWSTYYLIITVFNAVRMLGMFLAAALFWRCGPRVMALFAQQPGQQELLGNAASPDS
jgi:hypothetical protein